ncbi:hypothetical protein ACHMWN_03210 [Pedobacter sp. UC225_61]|uniref:hypothetical protein n=1 Tax=Pedobacter sp. UC225_61 TaxID=3374623 RepID=UPI00378B92C3
MKRIAIILFFLCSTSVVFGQKKINSSIEIQILKGFGGEDYTLSIYRTNKSIKILYKHRDSVSYKLNNDLEYKKCFELVDSLLLKNEKYDSNKFILINNRMKAIESSYSYYRKDSLIFKRKVNREFDILLDSVFSSSTEKLENKTPNVTRLVLDGHSVNFIINKGKISRKIYTQSPDLESHPLLTKLQQGVMIEYKKRRNRDFITNKAN